MTDATPTPGDDAPTFDAPWQARAFALAVALADEHEEDALTWREFQSRLVAEIEDAPDDGLDSDDLDESDPESVYYQQWLAALERVLVDRGVLDPGEFASRVDAFERGDRDAHEFVDGDPHAHADHDHDH